MTWLGKSKNFGVDPVAPRENLLPYDGMVTYHPGFLPHCDLGKILWHQGEITLFGKRHPIPRLQAWYGDRPYGYSGLTLPAQPFTPALMAIKTTLEDFCGYAFNGVLLNQYRHGQDSMGWHSDDEPELGQNPAIASLSWGASRKFHLRHKRTRETIHLTLESGSLLIMAGETQHHWQHQIPKTKKIIGDRINLTWRYVFSDAKPPRPMG